MADIPPRFPARVVVARGKASNEIAGHNPTELPAGEGIAWRYVKAHAQLGRNLAISSPTWQRLSQAGVFIDSRRRDSPRSVTCAALPLSVRHWAKTPPDAPSPTLIASTHPSEGSVPCGLAWPN